MPPSHTKWQNTKKQPDTNFKHKTNSQTHKKNYKNVFLDIKIKNIGCNFKENDLCSLVEPTSLQWQIHPNPNQPKPTNLTLPTNLTQLKSAGYEDNNDI
jgi:hypothetical protein